MAESQLMDMEDMMYLDNDDVGQSPGVIVNGQLHASSPDSLNDIELFRRTSSTLVTPNMDDLRLQLEAFRDVNEHLNAQIEKHTITIDQLTEERNTWKTRAKSLTKKLNEIKRAKDLNTIVSEFEDLIQEEDIIAVCNEIKGDVEEEDFTRNGVYLKKLIKRGKTGGWLIKRNEVTLLDKIGEGAFGATYEGRWRGTTVCVKCISVKTKQELISFLRETEALGSLRHPNILPFFGACMDSEDSYWLLCEYMPKGTLSKWLYGDRQPARHLIQRLEFALQVARAMDACQKSDPPILHRDLKPSNVFIDAAGNARLGDFGLARRMHPGCISSMTNETGTYVYMSPEMIRHEYYNTNTDMWSWGVLLCELVTQALPYNGQFLTPIQLAMAVAENKIRPQMPVDIHPELNALADSIFQHEAGARPTFEAAVYKLSRIIKEINTDNGFPGENTFFQKLKRFGSSMSTRKETRNNSVNKTDEEE